MGYRGLHGSADVGFTVRDLVFHGVDAAPWCESGGQDSLFVIFCVFPVGALICDLSLERYAVLYSGTILDDVRG